MSKVNSWDIVNYKCINGQRKDYSFNGFSDDDFWKSNNHKEFVKHKLDFEENCFIKYFRFSEHEKEKIRIVFPGIKFIRLCETLNNNLPLSIPKIYSLISRKVQKKTEYFIFMKLIPNAIPLDKIAILTNENIENLFIVISKTLAFIHGLQYWHNDIKEGNLLYDGKNYFLIDIDSCCAENDNFNFSQIPKISKDFTSVIQSFFSINERTFYDKISGKVLNLLQILLLISAHKYKLLKEIKTARIHYILNDDNFCEFLNSINTISILKKSFADCNNQKFGPNYNLIFTQVDGACQEVISLQKVLK